MCLVSIIGRKNAGIIFSVPLPNRPPVHMSVQVSGYSCENSGIVIVDAEKFLQLWHSEPCGHNRTLANGNSQTWPDDYKYQNAAKLFSNSHNSSVNLAQVYYRTGTRTAVSYKFLWFGRNEHQEQFHYIDFKDGITRTIWLLANGCKAFPVECDMQEARELHQIAAAPGVTFHTVGELAQTYQLSILQPHQFLD